MDVDLAPLLARDLVDDDEDAALGAVLPGFGCFFAEADADFPFFAGALTFAASLERSAIAAPAPVAISELFFGLDTVAFLAMTTSFLRNAIVAQRMIPE